MVAFRVADYYIPKPDVFIRIVAWSGWRSASNADHQAKADIRKVVKKVVYFPWMRGSMW